LAAKTVALIVIGVLADIPCSVEKSLYSGISKLLACQGGLRKYAGTYLFAIVFITVQAARLITRFRYTRE